MEKILEADDGVTYRFQCRCLEAEDAQDMTLTLEDFHGIVIESRYVRHGWRNWREKLRDAWAILRGKEAYMDGFVFRKEDLRPAGELFLKVADDWEKWKAHREDL